MTSRTPSLLPALLVALLCATSVSAEEKSFMSRLFGGGGNTQGGLDMCGAEFDRPLRHEGRSWTVIAAHADVRVFNSCKGDVTSGLAAFRDTFYVVAEEGDRLLLAQWNSRERKIESVVGWAERGALVLERTARRAPGKLAYRKALIVNKGREGSAGAFREADAFAVPVPGKDDAPINKLGVFQIYYVFTPPGMEDGEFELLGLVHALPSMKNARELLGWVPKKRILYWPHRQALEINKSPEALAERQRYRKPALAFEDLEKMRGFYKREVAGGANLDPRNRAQLEGLGVVALEQLAYAEPWPPYVNRWPILDSKARAERQFGLNAYQVGVIGDIELRANGNGVSQAAAPAAAPAAEPASQRITSEEFYARQAQIQEILTLYENVDILFIVDLTKSIRPFLPAIADGIRQAMEEIRGRFAESDFKPRIRFALAGFRDARDRVPFEWLSRREVGGSVEHFHQDIAYLQRQLAAAAQRADSAVARYPENTLGAIRQAVAEARFTEPHSYRAVFVIGDAGSVGDPGGSAATCRDCGSAQALSKDISRLLTERRTRLFPIQVRSPWTEQRQPGFRAGAALFAAQSDHLRGLNGNWVAQRTEAPNEGAPITAAVVRGIFTGERESSLAQCVLQQIAQGNSLDYVRENPQVCTDGATSARSRVASAAPPAGGSDNELIYGVVMMVGDVIRQTISDDDFIRKNRIQAFDTGYVLQRHPELQHDYVYPVVLMSLPDLQRLVGILAHVTDQPLRPRDLGRIWKAAVASELGEEARDRADSYYAAMDLLDIPVQSEILKRPFSDFDEDSGNLSEEELDRLYLMLREKWEQLSNIFHGGKKNFFTIYQRDYTWIPVSVLP